MICQLKVIFHKCKKTANVTPVYKNDSRNKETNCRPVSIFSNLSKVYEKCMFD